MKGQSSGEGRGTGGVDALSVRRAHAKCDDIAFFLYFYSYYSYSAPFRSVPLHFAPLPIPDSPISLIAVVHRALRLRRAQIYDRIPYTKHYRHMTPTAAAETRSRRPVPQDTALHVVSGPLVYKPILDEAYVLTRRLDPIDAFRVCPASRLNLIVSDRRKLRLLTRFYLPDFKPYRTHFPALVS